MAERRTALSLEDLDQYLLSDNSPDGCMLISDLDGFLTGIVVGPVPIPPSDWLPAIWGGEEPEFESEEQKHGIVGAIMGRHTEIAAALSTDPDTLDPIFYQGADGEHVLTAWAAGFLDAIRLQRKAWEPLFKDLRARVLLVPLLVLGDHEDFFEHHPSPYEKDFHASAPDMLRNSVIGIYDFWQNYRPERSAPCAAPSAAK